MKWYFKMFDFNVDYLKNKLELSISFYRWHGDLVDVTINAISARYGANSQAVASKLKELAKWCDDFEKIGDGG